MADTSNRVNRKRHLQVVQLFSAPERRAQACLLPSNTLELVVGYGEQGFPTPGGLCSGVCDQTDDQSESIGASLEFL